MKGLIPMTCPVFKVSIDQETNKRIIANIFNITKHHTDWSDSKIIRAVLSIDNNYRLLDDEMKEYLNTSSKEEDFDIHIYVRK